MEKNYFRIYSIDKNGKETFERGFWTTSEEVLNQAKNFYSTGEYDRVMALCFVPEDDNNVITIWDSKKEDKALEEGLEKDQGLSAEKVKSLIDDEYEAVEGYISALQQTLDLEEISLLSHILDEEISHITDLKAMASTHGISIENLDTDKEEPMKEHRNLMTEGKKFNLKDQDDTINAAIYSKLEPEKQDELIAVDPSLGSTDENNRAKIGDALLECVDCQTIRTLDIKNLKKEKDSDIYNKGDEFPCPHCGGKNGYHYVAQLAAPESEDALELEKSEGSDSDVSSGKMETTTETPDEEVTGLPTEKGGLPEIDESLKFDNDSFDEKVTTHLKELYENVKCYKTAVAVKDKSGRLIVEGFIYSNKGKKMPTSFVFKQPKTINNKVLFEGYNKSLSSTENAFKLNCTRDKDNLMVESLDYDYRIKDNGKEYQVLSD